MRTLWKYLGAAVLGVLAVPLLTVPATALSVSDKAPAVDAASALAGKTVDFHLSSALTKHAVVLYFFPKAFSQG